MWVLTGGVLLLTMASLAHMTLRLESVTFNLHLTEMMLAAVREASLPQLGAHYTGDRECPHLEHVNGSPHIQNPGLCTGLGTEPESTAHRKEYSSFNYRL